MQETRSVFKDGRPIVTRLSKLGERPDREFDIEFWRGLTSEQRADAVWAMVVDYWAMKGKTEDELRLQRSVESIRRGGRLGISLSADMHSPNTWSLATQKTSMSGSRGRRKMPTAS